MTIGMFTPSAKSKTAAFQKKGLTVRAAAATPSLWIYGPIGDTGWEDGFDQEDFLEAMALIPPDAKNIEIRINSEGGDAMLGQAIYAALTKHSARKTVHIDGFACSAASLIAMCGDEIRMAEGAFLMIHNARTWVSGYYGESRELETYIEAVRKTQTILDMVSSGYATAYVAKCKKPETQVQKWMDDETWFSAAMAKEQGFCDVVDSRMPVSACSNIMKAGFQKLPDAVKAKLESPAPSTENMITKLRAIASTVNQGVRHER